MIVGNGLLAKAFEQYKDIDSVLIFASGVSNSRELNDDSYTREFDLLSAYKDTNKKLVYFSTTSVQDPSIQDSKYVQHKLKIENYISTSFKSYIIFRLPIVVGNNTNKNTFFNGFRNAILEDNVHISKDATRYLIDVDDLVKYLPMVIDKETNIIMNVCFNNKTSVQHIASLMGKLMNRGFVEHIQEGGADYSPDNRHFLSYIPANSVGLLEDYTYITLKKYLQSYDNILSTE